MVKESCMDTLLLVVTGDRKKCVDIANVTVFNRV